MAKKAKMMKSANYLYSLEFDSFFIDFDVKKEDSIEYTRRFSSHGPDFVFVVAETWLRTINSRHLIVPATHPGNLIEELKEISSRLENPPVVPNLENLIPRGGWCAWMRSYWNRVNDDGNTVDDEAHYDLLIPLSLMESRQGHIAVYRYSSMPTIEVATRPEDDGEVVTVWSNFDPKTTASKVQELKKSIAMEILNSMR